MEKNSNSVRGQHQVIRLTVAKVRENSTFRCFAASVEHDIAADDVAQREKSSVSNLPDGGAHNSLAARR